MKGTDSDQVLRCMSLGMQRGAEHDAVAIDCQWCVNHVAFFSPGTREDNRGEGGSGRDRGLEADGQDLEVLHSISFYELH